MPSSIAAVVLQLIGFTVLSVATATYITGILMLILAVVQSAAFLTRNLSITINKASISEVEFFVTKPIDLVAPVGIEPTSTA